MARDDNGNIGGVGHTDSIASQESDQAKQNEKKKSKRPANTAFRQQRLKAWQPILTPKTVLPLFFAIGVIFAPIGGLLLYASAKVQMIQLDYTKCATDAPLKTGADNNFTAMPAGSVTSQFKNNGATDAMWQRENISISYDGVPVPGGVALCTLQFRIPEDMGGPVLFYYHLTNFYQNHRRYVNSFFDKQLKGEVVSPDAVRGSNCDPLRENINKTTYYPCGLIANSIFNDTFHSPVKVGGPDDGQVYEMQNKSNIAWASDKILYGKFPSQSKFSDFAPPPNWHDRYPNGYTESNPPPDLSNDETFMVWMRTAGLPTFSKLAQRNDTAPMTAGQYHVKILSYFPVDKFQGTKSIIITTRTVMGGKNPFLGIAYIVVGGICILLGVLFTVTHMIKPRKLGDHTYLSWNNAPSSSKQAAGPSTATASGRDIGA